MGIKIEDNNVPSPILSQSQEDKNKVTQKVPPNIQESDETIKAAPTCIDHTLPLWMQTGECKTTHSAQNGGRHDGYWSCSSYYMIYNNKLKFVIFGRTPPQADRTFFSIKLFTKTLLKFRLQFPRAAI